ncbi:hypothetical protein DMA11_10300 [Marinilabiliaceae bacterium JC017]|nr:hypothetical protein DMA11_10300 [Marinilabiliaceae bacterium JC017]
MLELDKILDSPPTEEAVIELAETRIRNLQAHRELENYNEKGHFLNKHPLLNTYSLREELKALLADKPAEFLNQYALTRENVKRYTSYLKSEKRKDKRENDEINLLKHQEKERVMKEVLEKKES